MPCHTRDIWMVSLHCEFCCEQQGRMLQTVHSNGFSPEWIRLCTASIWFPPKHLPHSVHLYLLLWTFMCCFKQRWVVKHFSHWVHEYNLSLVCVCWWWLKFRFVVNRLSHTVHKYGLGLPSCGCSVISLLSASTCTSNELSPVQYAPHANKIKRVRITVRCWRK